MPLPDYGQSLLRAIQTMAARLVLDSTSNSLQVIDFVHHEVHEGDTYQASFKTADGAPLADNARPSGAAIRAASGVVRCNRTSMVVPLSVRLG